MKIWCTIHKWYINSYNTAGASWSQGPRTSSLIHKFTVWLDDLLALLLVLISSSLLTIHQNWPCWLRALQNDPTRTWVNVLSNICYLDGLRKQLRQNKDPKSLLRLCICSFSPLHSSSPGGLDIVWPWAFWFYIEGSTSASTLSTGGKVDKIKSAIYFFPLNDFFLQHNLLFTKKTKQYKKKYQKIFLSIFSFVFSRFSYNNNIRRNYRKY